MATYVEPGSVESIRQGIASALTKAKDPTLREHVRQHYVWERITEKTAQVYREALGKS